MLDPAGRWVCRAAAGIQPDGGWTKLHAINGTPFAMRASAERLLPLAVTPDAKPMHAPPQAPPPPAHRA
jgi:hypothetical protein